MLRGVLESIGILSIEEKSEYVHPHIATMSDSLKEAMTLGIAASIKIVVRGARGTGKTCMLCRLQGKPIPTAYSQSQSITAASFAWRSRRKANSDIIRIDAWDVVDSGCAQSPGASTGGVSQTAVQLPAMPNDASVVDVYQGCSCVVFMVDVRRPETLMYVETEGRKVPPQVVILVCLNFTDCPAHEQKVTEAQALRSLGKIRTTYSPLVSSLTRGRGEDFVGVKPYVIQSSMVTGRGLSSMYAFLEVPVTYASILGEEELIRRLYSSMNTCLSELGEISGREGSEKCLHVSESEEEEVEASSNSDAKAEYHAVATAPDSRREAQKQLLSFRDDEKADLNTFFGPVDNSEPEGGGELETPMESDENGPRIVQSDPPRGTVLMPAKKPTGVPRDDGVALIDAAEKVQYGSQANQ